ncbi:uncharacterized protein LOC105842607 [Bombyx mori]|uniref:Uncharacterized protein n=1 Tax=Bombyx mori TaxID=7091 RepID=A0A8R2M8A5_BOMMO|nr:uncharacterized protein LOC105842607 [Bombyx mori]XP_037876854.1 uncharacterized protein LOC105842607 [Bombyx mori]
MFLWRAWTLAMCACAVMAQRIDQEALLSPRPARVRDRDINKDEPTCDQLKAMWRFSKRQARAPEIMNEVSSYRDPLMYNEWPVYTAVPRAAPRFRYQYPTMPREAYGRVVTKAPPNVVRTPDYDEMFGMLNVPHTSGKILRYPGPSRPRGGHTYMVPPQRDRFEALKKLIRQEHVRELHRKYETEQKQELKDMTTGHNNDDYVYGAYGEQEPRGLQPLQVPEYSEESSARHSKKPPSGSRQVSQFSRYSDVLLPPVRRTFYHPYIEYTAPEYIPYVY